MPTLLETANELTIAISNNNLEAVKKLYEADKIKFDEQLYIDDEQGLSPPFYVRSVEMVKLLAELGLNWGVISEATHFRNAIGFKAWTPDELPIVEELVKQGVDINEPDDFYNRPLTQQNDLKVVKYFVKNLKASLSAQNKAGYNVSAEWKTDGKKLLRAWSKAYLAEYVDHKRLAMLEDDYIPEED